MRRVGGGGSGGGSDGSASHPLVYRRGVWRVWSAGVGATRSFVWRQLRMVDTPRPPNSYPAGIFSERIHRMFWDGRCPARRPLCGVAREKFDWGQGLTTNVKGTLSPFRREVLRGYQTTGNKRKGDIRRRAGGLHWRDTKRNRGRTPAQEIHDRAIRPEVRHFGLES